MNVRQQSSKIVGTPSYFNSARWVPDTVFHVSSGLHVVVVSRFEPDAVLNHRIHEQRFVFRGRLAPRLLRAVVEELRRLDPHAVDVQLHPVVRRLQRRVDGQHEVKPSGRVGSVRFLGDVAGCHVVAFHQGGRRVVIGYVRPFGGVEAQAAVHRRGFVHGRQGELRHGSFVRTGHTCVGSAEQGSAYVVLHSAVG